MRNKVKVLLKVKIRLVGVTAMEQILFQTSILLINILKQNQKLKLESQIIQQLVPVKAKFSLFDQNL